ncbi:hypothetical protein GIB67_020064, partial [Kingdonia uniflora]
TSTWANSNWITPAAHDWLLKEPFEQWDRSHFDFTVKCVHITNNFSESFNMWILKIRDMPIHKLLEKLNKMLMKLVYDRRLKAKEWEEAGLVLVPRAQTNIDKMIKCYGQYHMQMIISGSFLIIGINGQRWRVNTNTHECDCHEWQLSGLPCVHVVSVIFPYNYVSCFHKVDSYVQPYKNAIYSVVDGSEWEKGTPATPRPRVARAPKRVDTNVSMEKHMSSVGLPPATPNMRRRGKGGIGGGGGRSSRGARQTQDTEALRPTQFAYNKDHEVRVDALINIRKSPNEMFEAFTKQFLDELRKVENLNCTNVVLTYSNALPDHSRVKEYIVLHKPRTLKEILSKVNRYIDLECLRESNRQRQASTTNHNKPLPSSTPMVTPVS